MKGTDILRLIGGNVFELFVPTDGGDVSINFNRNIVPVAAANRLAPQCVRPRELSAPVPVVAASRIKLRRSSCPRRACPLKAVGSVHRSSGKCT